MTHWLSVLVVSFIYIQDNAFSLRLFEVRVPKYVTIGSSTKLECVYDLDDEVLYSVKWYKGGDEFYRYLPRETPSIHKYLLPGITVDEENSNDRVVCLNNVSLYTAGIFRCEVSGEAPSFQTVTDQGTMVVVSLPDQVSPKINGSKPRYQIGDWVNINCTAGRSKPAIHLKWFVNEIQAEPSALRSYDTSIDPRDGMETSILGLQFRVQRDHFRNGDMKLKCLATLANLYWRTNEESIQIERQQSTPAQESRGTIYISNSRTDPERGNYTDSITTRTPSIIVLLVIAFLISTCWSSGDIKLACLKRQRRFVPLPLLQHNCLLQNHLESKHIIQHVNFYKSYSAR